ncbi:hypothetical protein NDI42_27075 [Funiculus sociatus GB2-C1]
MQRRIQKQQNPYLPNSLAWATWLIARRGGWSGYRSQRPLECPLWFMVCGSWMSFFRGWKLAQTPLVCTLAFPVVPLDVFAIKKNLLQMF